MVAGLARNAFGGDRQMTEEQIERAVERQFDALDARFMSTGSSMTQAEYDAAVLAIGDWSDRQYRKMIRAAEGW
jgi:hypothetical protein